MPWRILCASVVLCTACGNSLPLELEESVATQLTPIVSRVVPNTGKAGDSITILGMGFTASAPENIILVGGTTTSAATYALVTPPAAGEIEQLTFTVPATAAVGATTITVTVFDRISNSDVAFTITP